MDRIKKLETLIEKMRTKLTVYLDEEISFDEIYKLNDDIDKLIIEHYNLLELKELETLIEKMRTKLEAYLDEEISFDEIYKLSNDIDKLVVEHCNLLGLKK